VGDYGLLAVFGYVDERLEDNTHWGFDFVLTRVKSSCDGTPTIRAICVGPWPTLCNADI
jgi:hypothetical protein